MRRSLLLYLLFTVALLCGLTACGKIELEEPNQPDKPDENTGGGNTGGETTGDVLTVSQLAEATDGDLVQVGGYIVGFVPTNSIKKTVFGTNGAVESNVVIADRADCTDTGLCAAIQLVKDTDVRDLLNLSINPDNLGRYVVVTGTKARYCAAPGIKEAIDCTFDENPQPGGGDEPGGETPEAAFPTISEGPAEVLEGC